MTVNNKLNRRQKLIIVAILLSAFTGLVIGFLRKKGLDGSALLYIGVPTIIGLAFATMDSATSAVGSTLKALTFIILVSGPLLQEGFVCMIMAAPILYIIGALAAWPFDHYRKKKEREQDASKLNMFVLPTLLLFMSMEGVTDSTSFDRYNIVEKTQVVDGSINEVKSRLGTSRAIPSPTSLFAKIFPRPDVMNVQGLSVGDKHWVDISYVKWIYWNEKRGATYFEVVEHQPGYIKFRPTKNESYLKNYLDWGESTVFFEALADNRTKVTWQIHFMRKLDPAWYVQPLQRYAVGELAATLIASIQ